MWRLAYITYHAIMQKQQGINKMILSISNKESVSFMLTDSKFWRKDRKYGFVVSGINKCEIIGNALFASKADAAAIIEKINNLKSQKKTAKYSSLVKQVLANEAD